MIRDGIVQGVRAPAECAGTHRHWNCMKCRLGSKTDAPDIKRAKLEGFQLIELSYSMGQDGRLVRPNGTAYLRPIL